MISLPVRARLYSGQQKIVLKNRVLDLLHPIDVKLEQAFLFTLLTGISWFCLWIT